VPYGLERLAEARAAGFVFLVEGESDCWALWRAGSQAPKGLPALGVPGATMAGCLRAEHLRGIDTIYVHQEPGAGGLEFVRGVSARLDALGWPGSAQVWDCGAGVKDPCELMKGIADCELPIAD